MLKTRMLEGRRAKAQRGELFFNLPRGYVRSRTGEIVFDSDEQVQATVHLVFDTFERRRTINRSYVATATDVLGVVRGGRLWEQGCRTDFLTGVMAQHFLLSAAARSLSFAKIMRMSDTGVENVFLRLRWPDTDGKPTCWL